ncbi:MAG: patatin-like phospholipase family protein [Deltaproteobacteria bacterium]|nr:patatin-like phospholipase family protein [Deltaproteobacteria bacterium]
MNKYRNTPLGETQTSAVGVVFSSGFFGFFAHAGFLAAIRELEITPVAYAGSSSGAIVAAMAASGMDDHAIREMLFSVRKEAFWDPDPWHVIFKKAANLFRGYSGYLKGEGFARLLERMPVKRFEDCETPLAIAATNLTQKKGTVFTRGNLIKAIRASGAVPMLFKPVEIDGSLYVDGGVVDKAPLKALADLVDLDKVIIHFIASGNVGKSDQGFLEKRMSPWHVQYLAANIARQEAYERQLEILEARGVEVIEVKTGAPAVGPNKLNKGPAAYETAKAAALKILSDFS